MKPLADAHLRGIVMDPEGPALVVEYGTPDQGGACLVHRFSLPSTRTTAPTCETRYLSDRGPGRSSRLEWSTLPSRLADDVLAWLREQKCLTRDGLQCDLSAALRSLREVIEERAKNHARSSRGLGT